ncbi:FG-GAP repeat protein [Streptomyces sp. NPDC050564]|uniref:FG-GAP repeat protein n=1 Tax=Streptomyces sp. NPDC050564 TaxID=3365631 RepID=UPI0037BA56E8
MSAADTNGDGYPDLAIGVAGEVIGDNLFRAGGITVLRGGSSGVTGTNARWYDVSTSGIEGELSDNDGGWFGDSVQLRDFNGDGRAELVASAPEAGRVYVPSGHVVGAYGNGFRDAHGDLVRHHVPRLPLGEARGLTSPPGRTMPDPRPWKHRNSRTPSTDESDYKASAGAITLLRGSASGATTTGAVFLTQDSPGVPGALAGGDTFGSQLLASAVNHDGRADLTAIAAQENDDGGATRYLPGAATSLCSTTASTSFGPGTLGLSTAYSATRPVATYAWSGRTWTTGAGSG